MDGKILMNLLLQAIWMVKTKTFGGQKFGELPQICQIRQYFPPPNSSRIQYIYCFATYKAN